VSGTGRRDPIPGWFYLTLLIALAANALATVTTTFTIDVMRGITPFALEVRAWEVSILPWFNRVVFTTGTVLIVAYLWRVVAYFRDGCPMPAPIAIRRRVISVPVVVAGIGLALWIAGVLLMPSLTLWRWGRWSPDLSSQQVLSPMVNGFLAATVIYLLVDLLFRRRVVPRVFPDGGLAEVPGAIAFSVRGRLIVFLVAVGFVPLFTLFGMVRAALARVQAGLPPADVVHQLASASGLVFGVYLLMGIGLTLALARTFTDPLETIAAVLRRIRAGDLDVRPTVTSSDEVGVVEDGVTALAGALREKERILRTFGRVVEPSIRDRLIAGDVAPGGELRTATVLFCDLRGFSGLAERSSPDELVRTLNEFFDAMTLWVRDCGGFVDKFIGDALLVVFGLFDDDVAAAGRASAAAGLRCARGMRERVGRLNELRADAGRVALSLKIGVHTGPVVAGTIGASERHDYTVVGDTVNIAARLEGLCNEHGQDLLVSETTWELATAVDGPCEATMRDAVALRGRSQPVRVFALA
jgi:adenylate cyclase